LFYKIGSNLVFKRNGNSIILVNSVHRLSYTAGDLRFASWRGRGCLWHRAGAVKATAQLPCASEPLYLALAVVVCPALFLCFLPSPPSISGEPSSQRILVTAKACYSSTLSLRAQPTHQFSLISPGNFCARSSSSRPAASPSRSPHRGQSSTVCLCPC